MRGADHERIVRVTDAFVHTRAVALRAGADVCSYRAVLRTDELLASTRARVRRQGVSRRPNLGGEALIGSPKTPSPPWAGVPPFVGFLYHVSLVIFP